MRHGAFICGRCRSHYEVRFWGSYPSGDNDQAFSYYARCGGRSARDGRYFYVFAESVCARFIGGDSRPEAGDPVIVTLVGGVSKKAVVLGGDVLRFDRSDVPDDVENSVFIRQIVSIRKP